MPQGEAKIETINELKIWLEGEFKLIAQGQRTSREDLSKVRERLHDVSNAVSAVTALDIPGKLEAIKTELVKHDGQIQKHATDVASLKTTMRTAYISMGIAGAFVGSLVTIALRLYEIFNG